VVVDRGVVARVEAIPAQEVAPRAFVDEDDLTFRRLRPLTPVDVAGA
jgi:hypothetical protein